MPRVRLDLATEDGQGGEERPDIRIDTDVFRTLSGEQTPRPNRSPTIVRWLESWRR